MISKEIGAWQRGVLPLLLLGELEAGPQHGYALGKALADRGFEPLKGATLYPALAKLEDAGHVETRWEEGDGGPGRKVYVITKNGEEHLAELRAAWTTFVERVG